MSRHRLYEIIEVSDEDSKSSNVYNTIMFVSIIVSIIPLTFKEPLPVFKYTDIITAGIFIADYFLRLITADYKLKKPGPFSFVKYPFTPMAIIDLLSILPTIIDIGSGFKLFRLFRIIKTLKIFRALKTFKILKAIRYSESITIILKVIKKSKDPLIAVCTLAAAYIFVSALIIFNVEKDTFNSFFDAVYWATVSLTTVGYGDIFPVTTTGRIITMISSMFGIAIVALPAGIVTAGYMDVIKKEKYNSSPEQQEKPQHHT